ncbi:MAG: WbqC family protein [Arenicellales bacterium]
MKLAIMQPYFFPYLGYWQLLNTVDRFVIYDDVNYIKRGWVNRNRILINGKPSYLTITLDQASQNKKICEISLHSSPVWRKKMIKSIENTYRKAPFYSEVFPVIEEMICYETDNLADFLVQHLRTLAVFLGITTEFVVSSRCYHNEALSGQERILDICKREGAATYINPQGGQALYDNELFDSADIDLRFIAMQPAPYKQRAEEFVPYLSVIDALMEAGPQGIEEQMDKFDLIKCKSSDVQ